MKTKTNNARIRDSKDSFVWRDLTVDNTILSVWQERDRLHISLSRKDSGKEIFSAFDEDCAQYFDDGFFKSSLPFGRLSEQDATLHASVFDYCRSVGLC